MKTIQTIAFLAALLGASALVSAEETETEPVPRESVNSTVTGNKDDSKWILAGLVGLMVLFGMRHDRHRHEGRDSDSP